MDVIGGHKLQFRVNAKRKRVSSSENYGPVHNLSAMMPGRHGTAIRRTEASQFRTMKSAQARPVVGRYGTFALALRPAL